MNLREQFEKETGKFYNQAPFTYFSWLEKRNYEMIELLISANKYVDSFSASPKTSDEIERVLKNNGVES